MKPEAVVFDLGKVLVDFDYGIAVSNLSRRSGRSHADLKTLIDQSPLLHRLESGAISDEQFFEEVRNAIGFPGGFAEFEGLIANIFEPIPEMIHLHRRLRAQGVPVFIFSNTNGFAVRHIRDKFPFFREFDDYILSYEHGSMKPDARLYEVVEEKTGKKGGRLVYLDDRPENIETGRLRGWVGIVHSRADETERALRQTGLLI